MAKRLIVATTQAPLKDVEPKPESGETFNLPVNKIPNHVETDFLKLKQAAKAQGITKLKNGERFSLSGYMKQCTIEQLANDLNALENGESPQ
ncbi:hypothetical protein F0267_25960 [Vibrio coralliilyticus]|uniref:hypothetical protein n=1 Tax=Vibrio TaxID=662 RepID=UPI00148D1103|nr:MULTISPECIES: hypothetical protein [Vibrio]NOH26215.1 hypothetical protein [Vibrio europaeus]NOH41675.1 hypothetical protein [Vibrio coralliilyticus]